ncbi:hypothetical protein EDD18DRAFT_1353366 [Armillaria luteobubalina]|uniref:Uncharacterized protein n=1 Tax=Armillaria luteobubalina TaxID=153913 RepID=A0AA39Q5E7_9AGAR|nr:hypothetical protein EDD18DRAFT_1353366 [Armillaria luteobubalina]
MCFLALAFLLILISYCCSIPRKKNRLLPPVSIISRQTHTSHGQPTLHHKVSYGEISAEEVESVTHSDVDNAEFSGASLRRHGCILFVDDEASKASQHSDDPSADDEAVGSDCDSNVGSSSSIEVIHVLTPAPSDDGSAGGEVIEPAKSLDAHDNVKPSHSHPLWSKTKMVKGAYVNKLLTSGNGDDVTAGDNVKTDPTISSRETCSKESVSDVYLEDLCQTPKTTSRAKGKTPAKMAASRCSSRGNKKEALSSNTHLEPELFVNPITAAITKTMSLSTSKAKKLLSPTKAAVPCSNKTDPGVTPVSKTSICASVPTSSVLLPIKPDIPKSTGKQKAPVLTSATSTKQRSSRKASTKGSASMTKKTVEPLFLPLDSESKASEPPPD